jgi:hypothetical protein
VLIVAIRLNMRVHKPYSTIWTAVANAGEKKRQCKTKGRLRTSII